MKALTYGRNISAGSIDPHLSRKQVKKAHTAKSTLKFEEVNDFDMDNPSNSDPSVHQEIKDLMREVKELRDSDRDLRACVEELTALH